MKQLTIVFGALAMLALASCQKEANQNFTFATNEAISAFADKSVTESVDGVTMRSANSNCNPFEFLPDCVEVTDSGEGEYPRQITLDFGDGCEGANGRVRSGQLLIELTGDMLSEGSVRTVTFQDFMVNDLSIEGSRTTTNLGNTEEGHPYFSRVVDVSYTNGENTFTRYNEFTVTWLSGYDTPECGDNVFQIEGSGSCVRPNGATVNRSILEPLILDQVCGYITQGVVSVDAPNGTRVIDFGDGSCDSVATVTIDDEEYEIDLNNFGCRRPH